jgi:hypothetical protein
VVITCQKCGWRFNEFEGGWWGTVPPSPAQCPRCFPVGAWTGTRTTAGTGTDTVYRTVTVLPTDDAIGYSVIHEGEDNMHLKGCR